MLEAILAGVGSGVLWGLTGFLKNATKKDAKDPFSVRYFSRSVVIGGLLGAYVGTQGGVASYDMLDLAFVNPSSSAIIAIANEILRVVENLAKRYLKIDLAIF